MEGHPFIDRVLVSEGNSFASLGGLFAALREKEHDLAIVPATVSVSLTSNLIAKLSGAPVRIGPGSLEGVRNPSGYLFTHPIDLRWPQKRHQTLKNLDILAPLGIDAGTASGGVQPVLGGMEDLAPRADGLLAELRADLRAGAGDSGRKIVGIHPGAAKPQNRWPVASYIELVSRLHERGWGVVVTIGPRDKEVHDAMQNQLRDGTKYLVNEPLRLVAAVVNKLDYFISNDTGVLHMAGALKVPTLGLYGPTDPAEWGPPGEKNRHLRSPDGDVSHLSVDEVYNCFLNYT
jgi:ADP-heptose:LPS heptosyltransferase